MDERETLMEYVQKSLEDSNRLAGDSHDETYRYKTKIVIANHGPPAAGLAMDVIVPAAFDNDLGMPIFWHPSTLKEQVVFLRELADLIEKLDEAST